MLSIPDMALLGAAALLLFGPEQLPRVVRKVGQFTREVQNTSQSFIREMERAAEVDETPPYEPIPYEPVAYEPPAPDPEPPVGEKLAEPRSALEAEAHPEPQHHAEPVPNPAESPTVPMAAIHVWGPAQPSPERDHPPHV